MSFKDASHCKRGGEEKEGEKKEILILVILQLCAEYDVYGIEYFIGQFMVT